MVRLVQPTVLLDEFFYLSILREQTATFLSFKSRDSRSTEVLARVFGEVGCFLIAKEGCLSGWALSSTGLVDAMGR